MRRIILFALFACVGWVRANAITVTFPAERQRLPAVSETYVIGAVEPNRTETLYINGVTTSVHRTGAFIQMVPVMPGTNTLTIWRGQTRLVRKFLVETPPQKARTVRIWKPLVGDDDPRLGPPRAWMTTGSLFANRVRSEPNGSDSLYFLPKGFVLRGAEISGEEDWVVVWLEGQRGYLPRKVVKRQAHLKVPSPEKVAPDPAAGFPNAPPTGRHPSTVRICVDAGHGGSDAGALAPHGWREKDVNLMQARAIRDALEKAGFQVVMTRDGDSFPELLSRPQTAYDVRADAFISVHHNSSVCSRDPRLVRHTTTYASLPNGLPLATCIQKHIAQVMKPVPDAGAQIKSLAVCRNPAVPSCLLEVDFINLPEGEEESWDLKRQKRIADAVVCGILDWMAK